MVAFDIAKIAKVLTQGAKTAFTALKENPVEGSIFDAAKKLGINNKGDLKAGIEMFKENPGETISSALNTLQEKGFKFNNECSRRGQRRCSVQAQQGQQAGNNQEFGGILGKLGIKNMDDLQAGLELVKEDPNGVTQDISQTLGLSENTTEKLGKVIKHFSA